MKDLYSLSRFYKKYFPEYFGLRRVKGLSEKHDAHARCVPVGNKFRVEIDADICEAGCIAFLVHEMAHARVYSIDTDETGHGAAFGAAYSIMWKHYERWIDGGSPASHC